MRNLLPIICLFLSSLVFAQGEKNPAFSVLGTPHYELGISALEWTQTDSELDLEDSNIEMDEKSTITVTPTLGFDAYVGRWWGGLSVSSGNEARGAALAQVISSMKMFTWAAH